MTTNELGGDWVGDVTSTIVLDDTAKKLLEAVNLLGSFSAHNDYSEDELEDELDRLVENGFLQSELRGETFFRGRSRRDGYYVYSTTVLGKLWLANCHPVEAGEVE